VLTPLSCSYLGRSSGKGSLSLWTQGLKSRQIIQKYKSPAYTGPAVKLGAGVTAGEALEFVSKSGFRVVTGECGTVGLVGGYSQGGGHGPLNGAYGLGSDNVLEWELVTGKGELIVASPRKNKDTYWALSGGGGGTYGVVLGATIRIHADGPVINPQLGIAVGNVNNDTYWEAVTTIFATLPDLLEGNNNSAQFTTWNDNIGVLFTFPDQTRKRAENTLAPLRKGLDRVGIPYVLNYAEHETYEAFYGSLYGPLPFGTQPPTTLLNSRIVPKRVIEKRSSLKKLIEAIRLTTEQGDFKVDCSAADVSQGQAVADNAVLPAWRDSIVGCNVLAFWNFTAPLSVNYAVKSRMVDIYAPAWDAATPGSGVYNNELDPAYKGDFRTALWGKNYNKLHSIKNKNDPNHLFYGYWAVGSDDYKIDGKGRLCDA
jgi:FAD/FMN-containing dehydrogenase